mmetsp:Transcript_2437/g.7754  ORF Transcript_2437/g.7754 Transcript_2437/m.7754 type:complete len:231 (-) Transcript_2437:381-1073(-)
MAAAAATLVLMHSENEEPRRTQTPFRIFPTSTWEAAKHTAEHSQQHNITETTLSDEEAPVNVSARSFLTSSTSRHWITYTLVDRGPSDLYPVCSPPEWDHCSTRRRSTLSTMPRKSAPFCRDTLREAARLLPCSRHLGRCRRYRSLARSRTPFQSIGVPCSLVGCFVCELLCSYHGALCFSRLSIWIARSRPCRSATVRRLWLHITFSFLVRPAWCWRRPWKTVLRLVPN